jgi:hypothetical protein
MKTVKTEDAVGMALAHDLTQIIPGEYKGARFKKGHIVEKEDIPVMLSMGKRNLYVLERSDDDVHEDEAGRRIASAAAGKNLILDNKGEGKVELKSDCRGILRLDREKLANLNDDDEVMFATIHRNQLVEKGQVIAGTRVIPLFVKEATVQRAEKNGVVAWVDPIKPATVGIVTTGSEIYNGIIKDRFGEILKEKFALLNCEVVDQSFSDDDEHMIADQILEMKKKGVDLIAVTGGMSVDPDDKTPLGIRMAGTDIITYGAPVLPGAMFFVGYLGETPVVGLPGCVMHTKASIFELMIPRILAGEKLTRKAIKALAEGGFCRHCKTCTFPACEFGKE